MINYLISTRLGRDGRFGFSMESEKLGQYVATNDMVTSPKAMVDIRTTVVNRPLLKGR